MQLVFYLSTFSTLCMNHLLYLMFRCDFDVMENLEDLNTPIIENAFHIVIFGGCLIFNLPLACMHMDVHVESYHHTQRCEQLFLQKRSHEQLLNGCMH